MLLVGAGTFASTVYTLGADRCRAPFADKDVLDFGSGPWGLNLMALDAHIERVKRWTAIELLPR